MTQKATPLLGLLVALGMLAGMLLAPQQAANAKQPPATDLTAPVTGTGPAGETFQGLLTIDRFASQGGELVAVGTLTGTLTNALGVVIGTVNQSITFPVDATATCDILHLELGPLDLDLLGLVVHLDKVVLDIDAESGPGNLLGNLLCAVAGLLDGGLNTNAIARLLNEILNILG
jgi:hypothetical protein